MKHHYKFDQKKLQLHGTFRDVRKLHIMLVNLYATNAVLAFCENCFQEQFQGQTAYAVT